MCETGKLYGHVRKAVNANTRRAENRVGKGEIFGL